MKTFSTISLIFLVSLFISVSAIAKGTPDTETPATEEICSTLVDATPGLYGLCVAYCEAHDAPEDLTEPEAIINLTPPNALI